MEAATSSEPATFSDALGDSPNKNDLQGRAKRPDKQIYVPRQKREENSESESPSAPNTKGSGRDENVNSNKKSRPPKGNNGGIGKKQYDDDYHQKSQRGDRPRRPPRDNGNGGDYYSAQKPARKNNNDDYSGEPYSKNSAERPRPPKQRPATAGHGGSSSSSSRTFHNSSDRQQQHGASNGSGSRRTNPQGEGGTSSGKKSHQHSNWNEDYEGDEANGNYFHDRDNNNSSSYHSNKRNGGYNSSRNEGHRYNASGENDYGSADKPQRRTNPRSNYNNGPSSNNQSHSRHRGSTELSLAEQTKAAEAIVSQLPDLLTGSTPANSRPHTAGSSQKYNSKNGGDQSNRKDYSSKQHNQYQSEDKYQHRSASNRAERQMHRSDRSEEFSAKANHYDQQEQVSTQNEEGGHGHRGGLLFVNAASIQQQSHHDGSSSMDTFRQQSGSRNKAPTPIEEPCATLAASHLQAIHEIEKAESSVMVNFQNSGLNLAYIDMLLSNLRHLYSTSIVSDSVYSLENNRDQAMWNGVFYKLYQILRYNMIELRQPRFAPSIVALVDDTVRFYDDICERLSEKYHVNVENSAAELKKMGETKSTKCARLLLQRLYISLGDLFRYRCSCSSGPQSSNNGDADKAQSHYETAQRLAPKNSHPFNQMAVLALMTKRRLDAVYFFCRALAASNPILSVSENLIGIFNDACRRAEAAQAFDEETERNRRQTLSIDSRRSEVWVGPDGRRTTMSGAPTTELDDSRYGAIVQRLPLSHLAQRLVDSILNVHGRIFSKVGMDSLPDAVSRSLWELEAALTVDLPLLTPGRLTQLTLLNFFSVWRSSADSSKSGNKSLSEIFAVEFVLDCAALIFRHARILFVEKKFDALRRMMPCVKLYSDWLMYNRSVWYPPPCALDPTSCPVDLDLFAQIAGFANITAYCDIQVALEVDPRGNNEEMMMVPIQLSEDDLVAGFAPFAKIRLIAYESLPGTDPQTASFAARLQRFRTLTDYLCGVSPPVLDYNLETNTYTSLISSVCRSEQNQTTQHKQHLSNSGALPPPLLDFQASKVSPHQALNTQAESELDAMRKRRNDLVAEAERKRAEEEYRRELMQQQVAAGNIVMEVRPLILVIDTNSIVDYMPAIRRIVDSNRFTIVIPLVVISELESLSLGSRQNKSSGLTLPAGLAGDEDRCEEHVPIAARDAISFFEMQFNRRNPRIKAMTSEGNFIDSIAFRDQIRPADVASNDDAILECALHYCKMNEQLDRQAAMSAQAGGSGTVIIREVVLVTCDRNLRIKAHLKKVPTCPMRTLLNWARIPATGGSNSSVH